LMASGVTLADPSRVDIRGDIEVGQDVFIDINVVLSGRVIFHDGVRIGAGSVLSDVELGPETEVKPMSILENMRAGSRCVIGPFARIRPGTNLADDARVGNFVEVKNAQVGRNSKINHLSYVGDASLGERVNIGAGTITCNYDGANKHRTVIEDDVFVGSDTQLVAPVRIAEGATIGAGSTITRDAPARELTLSRTQQASHKNWKRPTKLKKSD